MGNLLLQHPYSEGDSSGEKCLLQATASTSRLSDRPTEEEELELDSRKDSLERLSSSEGEEEERSGRSARPVPEAMEDSDLDEIVMDEQIADFASSVLAAISCWHYRAQALLSMSGTTVRLSVPAPSLPANFGPQLCNTLKVISDNNYHQLSLQLSSITSNSLLVVLCLVVLWLGLSSLNMVLVLGTTSLRWKRERLVHHSATTWKTKQ